MSSCRSNPDGSSPVAGVAPFACPSSVTAEVDAIGVPFVDAPFVVAVVTVAASTPFAAPLSIRRGRFRSGLLPSESCCRLPAVMNSIRAVALAAERVEVGLPRLGRRLSKLAAWKRNLRHRTTQLDNRANRIAFGRSRSREGSSSSSARCIGTLDITSFARTGHRATSRPACASARVRLIRAPGPASARRRCLSRRRASCSTRQRVRSACGT